MKRYILPAVLIVVIAIAVTWIVVRGGAEAKPSPTPSPTQSKSPVIPQTPQPETSPIDYSSLPPKASCSLKGTIRYLNANTYDNGNALFTYNGIDHPGRNVLWTVTPNDDIDVGPDIFDRYPLPDGTSLLSITLPQNPIVKRYTLTASVQYGRLVNGNVKVSIAQCSGSTTVILP